MSSEQDAAKFATGFLCRSFMPSGETELRMWIERAYLAGYARGRGRPVDASSEITSSIYQTDCRHCQASSGGRCYDHKQESRNASYTRDVEPCSECSTEEVGVYHPEENDSTVTKYEFCCDVGHDWDAGGLGRHCLRCGATEPVTTTQDAGKADE